MRLLSRRLGESSPGVYAHWCPGCNRRHLIDVSTPNQQGAQWTYNGDPHSPTFSPSIHLQAGQRDSPDKPWVYRTSCHYFLINGNLQYCGDSQHALSGLTVPLPDFPESTLAYHGWSDDTLLPPQES